MKIGIQAGKHFIGYSSAVVEEQRQAPFVPDKVYVERENGPHSEWTDQEPGGELINRFYDLLHGAYSPQNLINLFHCLPEIFAPIHEIASRVSDCVWELKKEWNDEIDYNDKYFNKLFSQPDPLHTMKQFVYNAVCYEILVGKQFWYLNKPDTLPDEYKSVLSWFNLPAHEITGVKKKNVDTYSATDINDFVSKWENANKRVFETNKTIPILHLDLNKGYDVNCVKSMLLGAEKAIKNLIPVYEARGAIYISRGALGFWVSRGKDESGTVPLTREERNDFEREAQKNYGVTNGKRPFGITNANIDFVRSAMSLAEMLPFDETLADAMAIYSVLRVPGHLAPSKDRSTFNNADTDMRSFYYDVIIPWAQRYANIWTDGFGFVNFRRYIDINYESVTYLQENKKDKAVTEKTAGDIWFQRWQNGTCSLNEWIVAFDGVQGTGNIFEKKLPELTVEELTIVKNYINLKAIQQNAGNTTQPEPGSTN